MADGTTVQVLCTYPVSPIYDTNHRLAHYFALAVLLAAPKHRWITPAAFAFTVLYSVVFPTLYIGALSIAPTRLGPSLDVFPLFSIFLVNTYALAAAVFVRGSDLIKGKRGWLSVIRLFVWLWVGFITASLAKSSFEKFAQNAAVEVQCFAEDATTNPANVFSVGKGLACENPCAVPDTSVAARLQEQLSPMLWGYVESGSNAFHKMAIPQLSMTEYAVVILFAVALASTLWINFFTSPQITRNTIFATLSQGKTDSRVRSLIARVCALTWYAWSYFAIGLVALATPGVAYVQEQILSRYPVAKNGCLVKQWLPWFIGTMIFLVKVAVWRRRRETLAKEKACRIRRFNTALRTLQGNTDTEKVALLPEHRLPEEKPIAESAPVSRPATPCPGLQQPKKHRIEIAETRKVRGFKDTALELKEWWNNPMGVKDDESANADEEKALLKGHY